MSERFRRMNVPEDIQANEPRSGWAGQRSRRVNVSEEIQANEPQDE